MCWCIFVGKTIYQACCWQKTITLALLDCCCFCFSLNVFVFNLIIKLMLKSNGGSVQLVDSDHVRRIHVHMVLMRTVELVMHGCMVQVKHEQLAPLLAHAFQWRLAFQWTLDDQLFKIDIEFKIIHLKIGQDVSNLSMQLSQL